MKWAFLLTVFAGVIFMASLASAADCTYTINARNTLGFLDEIPSLNQQLQDCPAEIPKGANFLFANGNTVVDILTDEGKESFTLIIEEGQMNSIVKGSTKCTQFITLTDDNFDDLLSHKDQISAKGSQLFLEGDLAISGCGVISKMRVWLAKLFGKGFIKKQAGGLGSGDSAAMTGGEDNCFETAPQGHQGYNQNQQVWDQYTSQTDGVCQSIGSTPDKPCVYTVQLSTNGQPYYLCWYNNDGSGPEAAQPITPGGRPSNCFDTTYQAHQGYNQNQALWDSYAADSDGVCQTEERTGTPQGGSCKHTVQLSTGGIPYYLCFYDE